jgi:hypothetical protein
MANNYVDYDYWIQGYGEDDLSQPDLYVVAGYWDSGYAENEGIGASITGTATVIAARINNGIVKTKKTQDIIAASNA